MSVVATVFSSDETISSHQVKLVQDFLSKEMGAPVEFRLRIIPSTELSAEEVMTESQAGTIGNPLDRGVKIVSPASEASAHSTDVPAVGPAVTAGSDDHGPTGSSGSPDDGLRGGSSRSPGVGPTGSFGSPDAGMAGSAESPDGGSKGSSGSPSAGGASSTQINAGDYNTPAEVMRSPNEQHVKEPATMPVR